MTIRNVMKSINVTLNSNKLRTKKTYKKEKKLVFQKNR